MTNERQATPQTDAAHPAIASATDAPIMPPIGATDASALETTFTTPLIAHYHL